MSGNTVASGFFGLLDAFPEPIELNIEAVNDAIEQSVNEHNRQLERLTSLLCEPTVSKKEKFSLPQQWRMVPRGSISRGERPLSHEDISMAWPMFSGVVSLGEESFAGKLMTVAQANERMLNLIDASKRFVRHRILCALLDNTSWIYKSALFREDDTETIYPLANGDSMVYAVKEGATAGTTDTHYLATASAISDLADPYPGIIEELNEHPENANGAGQVVCMVPSSLIATTCALSAFQLLADPNVAAGANNDVIVGKPPENVPGVCRGYHKGGCWIYEWRSLPSGYIIAATTEGKRPLRIRSYQRNGITLTTGLLREAVRTDYPFAENCWSQTLGVGAWNRVGAVVQYIGGGAYAIPTGYTYNDTDD